MIIHIPEHVVTDGMTRDEVLELEASESSMEEAYAEMLSDVYGEVSICGMEYDAAYALKEIDPIAYRVGYADYVSEYFQEVDPADFPTERKDEDE